MLQPVNTHPLWQAPSSSAAQDGPAKRHEDHAAAAPPQGTHHRPSISLSVRPALPSQLISTPRIQGQLSYDCCIACLVSQVSLHFF